MLNNVTANFTTHGRSHIYGLPCPSADSLEPMDHFCTFDVSKIIPKNTCYLPYAAFGQKPACIRDFWPKTYLYTQLLAKNLRMYMNFIQKPTYTEKKVVKIRKRVKPPKGSVNV